VGFIWTCGTTDTGEDISDVTVFECGNKACVGLDDVLSVVSTEMGPEISFASIFNLDGGLLYKLPVLDFLLVTVINLEVG
jgi:hypothetical protein